MILDNLTTTIVMVSLLGKPVGDREDRLRFVGFVVIAANAGGPWTLIGHVTTSMLWVKHKLGTFEVMGELFPSCLVCLIVPLVGFSRSMVGEFAPPQPFAAHTAIDIRP